MIEVPRPPCWPDPGQGGRFFQPGHQRFGAVRPGRRPRGRHRRRLLPAAASRRPALIASVAGRPTAPDASSPSAERWRATRNTPSCCWAWGCAISASRPASCSRSRTPSARPTWTEAEALAARALSLGSAEEVEALLESRRSQPAPDASRPPAEPAAAAGQ